jgi:cytochrome P450 family 4
VFTSGSRVLPKRSSVLIPAMCIHTRSDIWKNPLQFDPDRFLPENERNRPRCSFIPFSYGLRNCVGVCGDKIFHNFLWAGIIKKLFSCRSQVRHVVDENHTFDISDTLQGQIY